MKKNKGTRYGQPMICSKYQNHLMMPPSLISSLKTSEMCMPAYNSSCPCSSEIVEMNAASLRISPHSCMSKIKINKKSVEWLAQPDMKKRLGPLVIHQDYRLRRLQRGL